MSLNGFSISLTVCPEVVAPRVVVPGLSVLFRPGIRTQFTETSTSVFEFSVTSDLPEAQCGRSGTACAIS
jgi:hypothetical protein